MAKYTSVSIFDMPQHIIDKHLESTGQTLEEAKAKLAELDRLERENPDPIQGANPALKGKFTSDLGFYIPDDE